MYAGQRVIFVPEDEFNNPDKIDCSKFDPNEYILVRNASNIKGGGRLMKNKNGKLIQLKEKKVYKISHKNKEQQMLIDSMMDETINTVVVTGKAGTGKTFVILAAALQLIEDGKYDEIILARSLAPLSKDDETGFLPGDLIDKLAPQFANFTSNLEALHGGKWKFKKDNENILMNAGTAIMMHKIEEGEMSIMSVANALGASLKKKILIVDEAQSLDYKVLKCLVTRMEDSAKVVLLGDVEQQTSAMGRPDSSALYIANKVLAKGKRSSVLTLVKTERGEACEENLQLLNEFENNGGI